MLNRATQLTFWLLCCFSLCIFTLGISWKLNTIVNFGYQPIYSALAIDKTIEKYVPLNRFGKADFIDTDLAQRVDLFSDIVTSINHSGIGLTDISYVNKKGEEKTLLTHAEILHLNDVSLLVDSLTKVWLINNLLLIFFLFYFNINHIKSLTQAKRWLSLVFISFFILGFSLFGFTRIFYYLHTVIFPKNNQWFFYYEESLMTTLMKAPDLFAIIAVLILLLALPFYIIAYKMIFNKKYYFMTLLKRRSDANRND
jgi:hypothetical protein